jgi:hypothetical protein
MNSSRIFAGRNVCRKLSRRRRIAVWFSRTCLWLPPDELDWLAHPDLASVVSERIGVQRSNVAPAPQIVDADYHVIDRKSTPLP